MMLTGTLQLMFQPHDSRDAWSCRGRDRSEWVQVTQQLWLCTAICICVEQTDYWIRFACETVTGDHDGFSLHSTTIGNDAATSASGKHDHRRVAGPCDFTTLDYEADTCHRSQCATTEA